MADIDTVIKGLEPIIGCAKQEKWGAWIDTLEDALELLKEFAKDNDVPNKIVRCKDCKHLGCSNSHWFCKWLNRCVDDDWFCADGERK